MSDRVCIGRCNARPRREAEQHARALAAWQAQMNDWVAAPDHTRGSEPPRPVEPQPRWMAGAPFWCLADSASIRSALTDLDEQMTLRLMSGDGHGSLNLNERISSSPEPGSPSPAHDQLDELVRWLREWERAYRECQGWPTAPNRGASAPALTSSVAWLLAHLDGLLAHPDTAEGFGVGILYWHSQIAAAAKTKARRRPINGVRCPQCHAATLTSLEDDDTGEVRVECRNHECGANRGGPVVMTLEEFRGHVDTLANDAAAARRAS